MAPDLNPPPAAADFLAAAGWGEGEVEALTGDASSRRYFRVVAPGRSAILMDAPPPQDPRRFAEMAEWLHARGFAPPAILATDFERGLMLIEDFGDARMCETADAAPESELRLYEAAVDLLIRLQREPPAPAPPYDEAFYHRELEIFTDWYCPAVGIAPDLERYHAAWTDALAPVLDGAPVTVLRDYHAENIMLIDGGSETLGLLDFQDALVGHPAYDLVSLLQDARRDVRPELEAAMLDRYRRITGAGAGFEAAYHVLGAQRNVKILGIFTRLWKRDGKPRYPALCPRVWTYLERDLAHPALAPVTDWFGANVPAHLRGDPMRVAA